MKPRPTNAEFEELKRKRDESLSREIFAICEKHGWDREAFFFHASHNHGCYCACPDGPCQHTWDGPEYAEECMSSATCSLCGEIAMNHDMRCGP